MKILFHNIYNELNKNNFMFENHNTLIGDNLLSPLIYLKEYCNKRNITIATSDIITPEEADAIVFMDMPSDNDNVLKRSISALKPLYLLALESPLVRPQSYNLTKHIYFKKIFTWNDDLIQMDPNRYIKINYSFDLPHQINFNTSKIKKLCTMIAGYKSVKHPFELYSKRIEAIRWFETYHREDFDLYGLGWDRYQFKGPKIIRALNRIKPLTKLLAPNFPSYIGSVKRKKEILEKYKFAICFENARDIPGYITEKIFDCFFAGCIPIYWGANNISTHIPEECFIDKRKFTSYELLYEYIKYMPHYEYENYLNNIEKFLTSEKMYQFSNNYFANTFHNSLTAQINRVT